MDIKTNEILIGILKVLKDLNERITSLEPFDTDEVTSNIHNKIQDLKQDTYSQTFICDECDKLFLIEELVFTIDKIFCKECYSKYKE